MPITVFEVVEGSLAEKAGINCGDCVVKINGRLLENQTLEGAKELLSRAGNEVVLEVAALEGDDNIVPSKNTRIVILTKADDKDHNWHTPCAVPSKQPWHPVMWPQLRGDDEEKLLEDKPHCRIIRNVQRFFSTCKDPEERQKIIERMLMSLPTASKQKDYDPEEEEEERKKLAELRRLSLAMRGELEEEQK